MFNKILVPLDGSTLAENALKPGLALAERTGAEVMLLRVPVYREIPAAAAAAFDFLRPEQSREEIYNRAERYLKSVRQVRVGSAVPLRLQVVDGDPAGTIVDLAADAAVDLIVMSTHGRTGLGRWLLGSVTEKVLRSAPCPLMIVQEAVIPTKILIALDGSEMAEHALAPALAVARAFAGQVTLLRVLEPLDMDDVPLVDLPRETGRQLEAEVQTLAHREAESYLEDVVARYPQAGATIDAAVVSGLAPEAILDFAAQAAVDLIAMCTHGQSAQARWAYGSVTEKVVHSTRCATLVVRVAIDQTRAGARAARHET
jgi:nucleotide-binding universal stress UspA family protein